MNIFFSQPLIGSGLIIFRWLKETGVIGKHTTINDGVTLKLVILPSQIQANRTCFESLMNQNGGSYATQKQFSLPLHLTSASGSLRDAQLSPTYAVRTDRVEKCLGGPFLVPDRGTRSEQQYMT